MRLFHTVTLVLALTLLGCSEESTNPNTDVESGVPEILSLTAEKTQILYGGQDPTVLTCEATGGNLSYVWEVDLGDIIPLNASRSKVSFNGSACCVGEKVVTCTVSNSLGSDSKSIVITILEDLKIPEIITVEVDRTELQAGAGEKATFTCYAIGGSLTYTWSSDCGDIAVDPGDPSKATLTATSGCIGTTTVTCVVWNILGDDSRTLQITITE